MNRIIMSIVVTGALTLMMRGTAMAAPPQSAANYHLIQSVPIGGDGFWDYLNLDSAGRRIYISHGTHVVVLDADTYKVVGDIPNTQGVHGIALAPELGRGFTSNGRASTVTIFDLKTLKVLGEVKVTGENPDAIAYDPASKRAFTFNGRTGNSTVIDAAKGTVLGTIELDGKPEFAVADGKGHIYNNLENKSTLLEIDTEKMTVLSRWPMAPCEEPSGLAMDREHRRLFAGCHNQMMAVIDADSGKVIATPAIGRGVDANKFDPGTGLAFSSNGEGTLTVVKETSPSQFTVVQNATTERGARTMAVDLKTHRVILVTAKFGPPPAPTAARPHPFPSIVPGSFHALVMGME
jgi:DNA-binding beta-propeller fold protein YncE